MRRGGSGLSRNLASYVKCGTGGVSGCLDGTREQFASFLECEEGTENWLGVKAAGNGEDIEVTKFAERSGYVCENISDADSLQIVMKLSH